MHDSFIKDLRDALNHLYDPDYLRQCALALFYNLTNRVDAPVALQRLLEDEIIALKPKPHETAQTHQRRIFELLSFRYIDQFTQKEVADQLGISLRQYRRDQESALNFLALRLWEKNSSKLKIDKKPIESLDSVQSVENYDLDLVNFTYPENPTDFNACLPTILELTKPLSSKYSTEILLEPNNSLPTLAIHPVILRQIMLNLLTVAIHCAGHGQIFVSTKNQDWDVAITIQCPHCIALSENITTDDKGNLEIAAKLIQRCGGQLNLSKGTMPFQAIFTVPAVERLPILVVDDSTDTVQLLRRYATGTRYNLFHTHNPQECLIMTEKHHAQVVILDLMMPQIDGWEILGRLRNHSSIAQVPVIVCSILHQEELALSLGADAFLHKPFTRADFLAALDHVVIQTESAKD